MQKLVVKSARCILTASALVLMLLLFICRENYDQCRTGKNKSRCGYADTGSVVVGGPGSVVGYLVTVAVESLSADNVGTEAACLEANKIALYPRIDQFIFSVRYMINIQRSYVLKAVGDRDAYRHAAARLYLFAVKRSG